MRTGGTHDEPSVSSSLASDMWLGDRMRALVRDRPLAMVVAAGVFGATLGGLIFSRAGRLVFIAAVGFVANELWRKEGRIDVQQLVETLQPER
jgi:hypothetical protein